MDERRIQELSQKFLAGTATEEDMNLLHHWYDQQYNNLNIEYRVDSDASKEIVRSRIYRQLRDRMKTESPDRNREMRYWSFCTAAASLLILIVFTGLKIWGSKDQQEWIYTAVPFGSVQEILLPDSSRVWLNSGSKLQYPKIFSGKRRTVDLLEGQAFFEVTRDEVHPFEVQSNGLVVSVLGTSFDVKSYTAESTAEVSVQTGHVNVRYGDDRMNGPLDLLAGDQAVVQKQSGLITKELARLDFIGSWIEKRLNFENEPVWSVINALERKYDIKAEVESDEILQKTVSIKVDNQPLKDILEVLKYTLEFEYKMVDERTLKIYK